MVLVTSKKEAIYRLGCMGLEDRVAVGFDVETSGLNRYSDVLEGIGFYVEGEGAFYVPFREACLESEIDYAWFAEEFGYYAKQSRFTWVAHNAQFDLQFLRRYCGIELVGEVWDTMDMAHLCLDGIHWRHLGLKSLAKHFLGMEMKSVHEGYFGQPLEEQAEYCEADATATYLLAQLFGQALKARNLVGFYKQYLVPMHKVLADIEYRGWRIDLPAMEQGQLEMEAKLYSMESKFASYVKELEEPEAPWVVKRQEFKPRSHIHMGWLFEKEGYPLPRTAKDRASTSRESLLEVANNGSKIALALSNYNQLNDLYGRCFTNQAGGGLLQLVDSDGRMRSDFKLFGTVTGRSTTSKPNLKGIPKPSTTAQWGVSPREWFIASEGHKLIVADMSQAEVCMLAVLSGDSALIDAVNSGTDVHSLVASRIWPEYDGLPEDSTQRKMLRSQVKSAVFGSNYGQGDWGLAKTQELSLEEAQRVREGYFDTFPGIRRFHADIRKSLLTRGVVYTLGGRPRRPALVRAVPTDRAYKYYYILEYKSELETLRRKGGGSDEQAKIERAFRQCVNFPVQGSVAEVVHRAMVYLYEHGVRLLGDIYDEVVVEVPENEVVWGLQMVREAFPKEIKGVKFRVEAHVGDNWACGK